MNTETRQKHDLEVVDAVVRGAGETRPEDAELVDFALSLRAVRPLPDHGAAMRIDERVADSQATRRERRYPVWQLAAACACLILVAGVVAVNRLEQFGVDDRFGSVTPAAKEVRNAGGSAEVPESAKGLQKFEQDTAQALPSGAEPARVTGGTKASRKQERRASIALVASPEKFDRAADRIAVIASAAGGYVQTASTRVSDRNRARGTFLLMIPVSEYRETMAKLARLGHVRSQSEGVQDITTEYDSAERTLKLRRARTEQLENELQSATDDATRNSLKRKLRRAQIAERQATRGARSTRWRSNYVPVNVRLSVDSNAGAAEQGTISKAFDQAVEILEKLVAVLIVLLAVALPISALLTFAWWAVRRVRRGRADRALSRAATQPE